MSAFRGLQERLGPVLALNVEGSTVEHVVVALPSHSMPETLLSHHVSLLGALEHRFLLGSLQTARVPGVQVVVVTSAAPSPVVLDYYARLARPDDPQGARERMSCLVVPDDSARGVSAKLLGRPDLLAQLRQRIGGRPAVIEPWNVTSDEVTVALALDTPVNGTPPHLWPLGFKSASRRLFREAGIPIPAGVEDVHDAVEVAAAIHAIRRNRRELDDVVIKLDNSGSGEGNWVMSTRDDAGDELRPSQLSSRVEEDAPEWFLADLALGGVVEELVTGQVVTSPSAQAEIRPDGQVVLLATHEQILGGENGHVFTGSRFPAAPSYAVELGDHVIAAAQLLARAGAVGWVAVDFVAERRDDGWRVLAVDLNLRKGGTTHPYTALRHLVPGAYDVETAHWVADRDGASRSYRSSDTVGTPRWLGMRPERAISSLEGAGLAFDHTTGTGVILHMFSALDRDGTVGVTAIGRTMEEAEQLYDAVPGALDAGVGALPAHTGAAPGAAGGAPE